jgi:hypothetical protein
LLNFGPKAKFERKVYDNDRKGSLTWTEKQDTRKHLFEENSRWVVIEKRRNVTNFNRR